MNTKRYVQHISGQGEKFKVYDWSDYTGEAWRVIRIDSFDLFLPKSEYCLCEPPEEWEDVTKKYEILNGAESVVLGSNEKFRYIDHLHNGPAFIIERKKS